MITDGDGKVVVRIYAEKNNQKVKYNIPITN